MPQLESPTQQRISRPSEGKSYNQILKSSALIGGSSVLNIVIGMIRTKAMALFLGPAGFGLFGLYNSIADLTQSIAGLGINSSGVREIAVAVGSGDPMTVGRTAMILRRISVVLGVFGAGLLIVFSSQVSKLTFATTKHATAVCLLSIVVLFKLISGGQVALIQGLRRVADLAKISVLGALLGTAISLPLVYWFREQGIVPSLVGVALMTIGASWWYSRKISIDRSSLTLEATLRESTSLLKLGAAFMSSSMLTIGSAYVIRITIVRTLGYEGTGLYQSAWTLGVLYVSFILQAMGADFYPRLTAHIEDHHACNRLVNEQTSVGLLLAGPGVIASLAFAPVIISLLYSSKFGAAVWMLRWICLGTMLQVISWPMGFIIVAKARQGLFVMSELAWSLSAVAFAWLFVKWFGLNGAGIAFFGSYVFHCCMTYPIVRWLTGFRWSRENRQISTRFFLLICTTLSAIYWLPIWFAVVIGSMTFVVSCIYSIRVITKLVCLDDAPVIVRRVLRLLQIVLPPHSKISLAQG